MGKIASLESSKKQEKTKLDADILQYMKDKIRVERNGAKFMLIEEDYVIDGYNNEYKKAIEEKNRKIQEIKETITGVNGEIEKIKVKISALKEKIKQKEKIIKQEDDAWYKEYKLKAEMERLEREVDSLDDEDSYSSYSSSYSGIGDLYSSYSSYSGSSKSYSSDASQSSYSLGSSWRRESSKPTEKKSPSHTTLFKPSPTTKTWYLVKRNGKNQCIEVEHYTNNGYAAKRDMMSLYSLSSSDIVTSSSGSRNPWPTIPCNHFDGTNSH